MGGHVECELRHKRVELEPEKTNLFIYRYEFYIFLTAL